MKSEWKFKKAAKFYQDCDLTYEFEGTRTNDGLILIPMEISGLQQKYGPNPYIFVRKGIRSIVYYYLLEEFDQDK